MKTKKYFILSVRHSEGSRPTFWRSDNAGYTIYPWAAGIYDQEQVEGNLDYYNNGYDTLAIEISHDGLEKIGFKCEMDLSKVADLKKQALIEAGLRDKEAKDA